MYLHNIVIENMGAIERCEILEKDLIKSDGTPRLLILVGQNGSGKTTFLSSIVDAFFQFANDNFNNVLPKNGMGYKYLKVLGLTNQKINTIYGFNYLQFKNKSKVYEYIDKNGKLDFGNCKKKTNNLLINSQGWEVNKNCKRHTSTKGDKDFIEEFEGNCYCYFPSDRFEYPYWMLEDTINFNEQLTDKKVYSNDLNKTIIIRRNIQEIKNWILDVFLDQHFEVNVSKDDTHIEMTKIKIFDITIKNIEYIISQIIDEKVSLGINLRFHNNSRLKLIDETGKDFLPSLNNLSAGQSTLLSIFINIIKQSENINIMNSINFKQISGIAVIDEIDLHLHIDLQKEVLPKLIKLFPKVQFIVTTHSPFFLNGVDKNFDKDDYRIVNMPSGNFIEYNEYEEFNKAFEVFDMLTNNYKSEINLLKQQINKSSKPLIITEGKTDWKHLKKALERFKANDLYKNLDIEFLEYEDDIEMGDTTLDKMFDSYIKVPQSRKTIFLFDRDNDKLKKHREQEYLNPKDNLYSMSIPKISDELDKICLEFYYKENDLKAMDKNNRRLFFGLDFFNNGNSKCGNYQTRKLNDCYKLSIIDEKVYNKDDLTHSNSIALTKNDFAENILNEKENFKDFDIENFKKIFDIIEKIVC